MSKYVFNDSGADRTYQGVTISDQAYYLIDPQEEVRWANDSALVSDLGAAFVLMSTANAPAGHLTDVSTAVNYLKGFDPSPRDADNASLFRPKMAPTGWTFQARAIEFSTATLNSTINNKFDGTPWGDETLKFYDDQGAELTTQAALDTDCIKTVVDWTPDHDFEIVGGFISMSEDTVLNFRCYVVGAPGLADKVLINGVNFKFVKGGSRLTVDGRTSKRMKHNSPVPGTNKMRLIVYHNAGIKCDFSIVYEHYKA